MSDPVALKDYIDRDAIRRLGEQIRTASSNFPIDQFVRSSCRGLGKLEFTQRTQHVSSQLRKALPEDISTALKIISDCLPKPRPFSAGMFSDRFWLWPLSDFVRDYGTDEWDEAIAACYRLTQSFTAEFAIRPLLQSKPDQTLKVLREWTDDDSEHVRRLCSEGTRPRLPWASRLDLPRDGVDPILEAMKSDPSEFVRKSVANHLNDLGKDDPKWLLATMATWSKTNSNETQWIIRHALRNLIKQGNPKALKLIGYGPAKLKSVSLAVTPKKIVIGDSISAQLNLISSGRTKQKLLIDWIVHYMRSGGDHSAKVFKGREIELAPGETFQWEKKFAMKPLSTRRLYPGEHKLEVQVNGHVCAGAEFQLTDS